MENQYQLLRESDYWLLGAYYFVMLALTIAALEVSNYLNTLLASAYDYQEIESLHRAILGLHITMIVIAAVFFFIIALTDVKSNGVFQIIGLVSAGFLVACSISIAVPDSIIYNSLTNQSGSITFNTFFQVFVFIMPLLFLISGRMDIDFKLFKNRSESSTSVSNEETTTDEHRDS